MSRKIDFTELSLRFNTAKSRLIIVDGDGTWVAPTTDQRIPAIDDKVKALFADLAWDTRNHIVLISGLEKEKLDLAWGKVPFVLAAEYGGYYRNPGNQWMSFFSGPPEWVWKTHPAIRSLTFQYEGSYVVAKSYSIEWHYKSIKHSIHEREKEQIIAALQALPQHDRFSIYETDSTIELRTPAVDAGTFICSWMGNREYEFITAIGHRDEGLFKVLPDHCFCIRLGRADKTNSRFYLENQSDLLPFLRKLLDVGREFRVSMQRTGLSQLS